MISLRQQAIRSAVAWYEEMRRIFGSQAHAASRDARATSRPKLLELYQGFEAANMMYVEAAAAEYEVIPRSNYQPNAPWTTVGLWRRRPLTQ